MPSIRSLTPIDDGLEITKSDGSKLTIRGADIPEEIRNTLVTPRDYEDWINDVYLPELLTSVDDEGVTQWVFHAKVHVYSIHPLNMTAAVSDDPIPAEGWF